MSETCLIEENIENLNTFLTTYNEDLMLTLVDNINANQAKVETIINKLHRTQMVVESSNLGEFIVLFK